MNTIAFCLGILFLPGLMSAQTRIKDPTSHFQPTTRQQLVDPFEGALHLITQKPKAQELNKSPKLLLNYLSPSDSGKGAFPSEVPYLAFTEGEGNGYSRVYQLRKELPSVEELEKMNSYEDCVRLLGEPTLPSITGGARWWQLFQPLAKDKIRVLKVGIHFDEWSDKKLKFSLLYAYEGHLTTESEPQR